MVPQGRAAAQPDFRHRPAELGRAHRWHNTLDRPPIRSYGRRVSTPNRPATDLTARARIRDAALELFAEHGFAGTSMRSIATAAGVSLGLVQHHFTSKEGVRRACDDHVTEVFRDRLLALEDSGQLASPNVLAGLVGEAPALMRYLARAAVEDSPAASAVFDALASGAEQFLTAQWPARFPPGGQATRDAAAVMTAMHSGMAILLGQLVRRLDADSAAELMVGRLGLAAMDLYSAVGQYMDSEVGQQMRASLEEIDDHRGTEGAAP